MTTPRNSQATQQRLLRAAFREFQENGYRGADLNRILRQAGVTKGALYHHFRSKKELGYAVIEQILRQWIVDRWLRPLELEADILEGLARLARWGERTITPEGLALGCPLLTLSQELCGADEGFRLRLAAVYDEWRDGLVALLAQAQGRGVVRSDLDLRGTATFVIGAWQGAIGLARSHQTAETLGFCRQGLEAYFETLRPSPGVE